MDNMNLCTLENKPNDSNVQPCLFAFDGAEGIQVMFEQDSYIFTSF